MNIHSLYKRIIGLIACMTMVTLGSSHATSQTIEETHSSYIALMDSADVATANENWIMAERFLLEALRLEPANPSNLLLISNLGMIRFYQGRDSLALATLTDAHNMAPNAVVVLQNRAKVLSALGRHDEAYTDWSRIIEIDSTNVSTLYLHALASMVRNDSTTTSRDLFLMNEAAPDDVRTLSVKAQLLFTKGLYKEAISPLNKIIDTEPDAGAYSMRALCNIMTDRLNDASTDIAEGLRLDPADGELYLYRALLNKLRYRNDDAHNDAIRAIELGISPQRAEPLL